MGLLENEINDIRQLMQDAREDKITPAKFAMAIAGYSQLEKRYSLMLKAMAMTGRGMLPLETGLIGDAGAARGAIAIKKESALPEVLEPDDVAMGDKDPDCDENEEQWESDTVLCEQTTKIITVEACRKRYGSKDHFDSCMRCPVRQAETRKLVVKRNRGKL